jgi:hypothetical protein
MQKRRLGYVPVRTLLRLHSQFDTLFPEGPLDAHMLLQPLHRASFAHRERPQ